MWEVPPTPAPSTAPGRGVEGAGEAPLEDPPSLLLVGESPADMGDLTHMLASLGPVKRVVMRWNEAPPALAHESLACIIVDARRNWTVGYQSAQQLRSHPATQGIPLLFLMGHTCVEAELLRGYALGTVDCVLEPVHPNILRAKVAMFLELHQRQRALRAALARAEHMHAMASESERMLEEQHARLKAILQQLPVAVHIVEAPSGRTLDFNAQAEQLMGHPMLESTCIQDYAAYHAIHPDGTRFKAEEYPIARVLLTGKAQPQEELLYDRPDGSVRVFLINAGPIRDARGDLHAVVASFMDITALKRAETHQTCLASVSQILVSDLGSEEALAQMVERAVPDLGDGCALELLEPDDTLRRLALAHVDPVRREVSQQLYLHHPARLTDAVGPGAVIRTSRTELLAEVTDQMLAQYASDARHLELLRGTGITSSLIVPLRARDRTIGALCFFYCRGGRPRASRHYGQEERLLAEELARRAALAMDNRRLYHEAQRAVRLRDDFLSVASHELKTPLTPLQLKLSTLKRDIPRCCTAGPGAQVLLKHVEVAQRQLRKLSLLINALFDVSRLSQGGLELKLADTDLGKMLDEVVAWFAPEAARVGSRLQVEGESHVSGRWDPIRLEQVVTNLLSNAIRYGGGHPIHTRVEVKGGSARLVVRDEGIGISLEDQRRIFGKFERAVSDRHYGGLGLGLYITRVIVEALGGSIQVESHPGHGATFTVELPLSGPPDTLH